MTALIYIAIGYGIAQILSVKNLKAMYDAARKWIASFGKNGVGEADEYKAGGTSSDD